MNDLTALLKRSLERLADMTPEEREAMYRRQREGYVKAEMLWPKPKFEWVNGVQAYASYEDYCND